MNLTWTAFNNIRMLLMACMPVIIFYLIWLINTSEAIRIEEGTLLDLVCWPDGNAIPVSITSGSIVAIVIELYGLYQLFKASLSKKEYDVTNGLYCYIWALIVMIIIFLAIMFYCGLQSTIIRAKIKGGITKAMLRYSSHLPSKIAMDRLQTRFQCCGRANYQEWFYIPWFSPGASDNANMGKWVFLHFKVHPEHVTIARSLVKENIVRKPGCLMRLKVFEGARKPSEFDHASAYFMFKYTHTYFAYLRNDLIRTVRKFIADSVPYSCCNLNAMWPCIHHGIMQKGTIYKYNPAESLMIWENGCEEKLISEMTSVSWRFNAVMALIIITMILQVIAVRYLHTAYKNGLNFGNRTSCNSYLLRSLTDTKQEAKMKRKMLRKRKLRQARTTQWVTAYRPLQKRESSNYECTSSDELLNSIE